MRFANFPFTGLAQGLDIGAERQKGFRQSTGLHGDAKSGGYRAVGIPKRIEWFAHSGLQFESMKSGGLARQCGVCFQQPLQRPVIDPVTYIKTVRNEAPAMQEVGEILQGLDRLLIQFGT
ncbi:hypothetical protein D3C85_1573880 [compost metagenome]